MFSLRSTYVPGFRNLETQDPCGWFSGLTVSNLQRADCVTPGEYVFYELKSLAARACMSWSGHQQQSAHPIHAHNTHTTTPRHKNIYFGLHETTTDKRVREQCLMVELHPRCAFCRSLKLYCCCTASSTLQVIFPPACCCCCCCD